MAELDGGRADDGRSAIDGQRRVPFTALHLFLYFAKMSWKLVESGADNYGG